MLRRWPRHKFALFNEVSAQLSGDALFLSKDWCVDKRHRQYCQESEASHGPKGPPSNSLRLTRLLPVSG